MSVTVFPSVDGWITPRTDEVQLTDQNCKIFVDKPIDYITKLLINADTAYVGVSYKRVDGTGGVDFRNMRVSDLSIQSDVFAGNLTEVDVTKSLLEIDEWKTLTPILAETTFFYETKSTEIDVSNYWKGVLGLGKEKAIDAAIARAMQYYADNNGIFTFERNEVQNGEQVSVWYQATINSFYSENNIMNTQFRVYYEPLGESVKISTPKTEPVENEFAIPFSQQQQIVNNMSLGRNMQATANRTGVETRTICRKVDTVAKIRKVGTVWVDNQGNKWRLTNNTVDFSCGWAYCTETWSKNWMLQSEFVGINREFRSWNIPADTVVRNFVREEYCYITTWTGLSSSKTCLKNKAKELIIQTCNNDYGSATNDEATVAQIEDGNGNGGIVNVSAFGFGNSLVISGTTKDNLSIGIQRTKSTDDGSDETKRYCRDVYYTDENGEAQGLSIRIGNKVSNADLDMYPQSNAVSNTISDALDTLAYFSDGTFEKDASEKINFALQIHFISGDEDLIIGPGLASNCPLAKNKVAGKLKTWYLDKALPQGATVMTEEWGHIVTNQERVTANAGAGTVTIKFATCLTDENNNIIIANNNRNFINHTYRFVFSSNNDTLKNYILTQTGSNYRDAIN